MLSNGRARYLTSTAAAELGMGNVVLLREEGEMLDFVG